MVKIRKGTEGMLCDEQGELHSCTITSVISFIFLSKKWFK